MTTPTTDPTALDKETPTQRLQSWLDTFDRENAHDHDADDFNVGQDDLIEVPAEDLRSLLDRIEAAAPPKVPAETAGLVERLRSGRGQQIKRDTLCAAADEIERLKAALQRLGSVEAFLIAGFIDPRRDAELIARIEFARTALGAPHD